ncbi:aspartate-semialdehyde dehydrogenase [Bacteroidetes bacterium SCGC AAA795-G10]|nr:aspartate-semialdehyde dehydrogenase [Bacteroidetes bacterium SCGC AAA795-G10]
MRIAVVGVTGMVGKVMLDVLTERNIPISELIPVASEKSIGKTILFKGENLEVIGLAEALNTQPDIALFSAGGDTSLKWAPKFAENGTTVIDNSSAWRMKKHIKLIIPEINASQLTSTDKIIANPNCSTIQMVMAIAPLHKVFRIKRLVISTYQSITGTGVKAVEQLNNEMYDKIGDKAYPYQIHKNALPQCDVFLKNDYTKEEMKLVQETHKILEDPSIGITATAIRIPVVGGHSESVNIEFELKYDIKKVRTILNKTIGVEVIDDPKKNLYPMPINAEGKDEVFIGRIRRDESIENGLNLWIVSDNLRKGAATNTIQIAEYLIHNNIV